MTMVGHLRAVSLGALAELAWRHSGCTEAHRESPEATLGHITCNHRSRTTENYCNNASRVSCIVITGM